ncbi:DNA translocase FtsK [Raoultella terrigena]|uniref:DNA translocase FtsK n=1 Tax=Raoultella terrigena TaxID=577 RepID=A0A4V6J2U5_RAOTE|nr:DNA translocase FtsK [Raoultella terrigena]
MDDSAAEAELARQFAATQQQRYSSEQPRGANPFSPADYDFSPMKTLVDDGPSEPLFTPMPEVQPSAPQYQQPAQHQHQPVQQPQPVQHYQQPTPQPAYQQPQLSSRYNLRQRRRATSRSRLLRPRCSRRSNSRRRSRRRA